MISRTWAYHVVYGLIATTLVSLIYTVAAMAACEQKCKTIPHQAQNVEWGYGHKVANDFVCTQHEHDSCDGCTGLGATGWCNNPTAGSCLPNGDSKTRMRQTMNNCQLQCSPVSESIQQEAIIINDMGTYGVQIPQKVCKGCSM